MATEKRLIDANALSEKIGNMKFEITHIRGGYRYCSEDEKNEWDKLDGFDSLVCNAPTVDAVEVVRCKDCKSSRKLNNNESLYLVDECLICTNCEATDHGWNPVFPTHFCSYGERRTDNG